MERRLRGAAGHCLSWCLGRHGGVGLGLLYRLLRRRKYVKVSLLRAAWEYSWVALVLPQLPKFLLGLFT